MHTNSLTADAGYVIFLLHCRNKNEDMARELKVTLSNLPAKVEESKEATRKAYDSFVLKPLNFPRTDFQGIICFLLQKVEYLMNHSQVYKFPKRKHEIEVFQREFLCLRNDFSKIAEVPNHQWARFNDVTYQAEDVVDVFLAGCSPVLNFMLGLFDVTEEIKTITKDLQNVGSMLTNDEPSVQDVIDFPVEVSSETESLPDDVLLGSSNYTTDGTDDHKTNSTPELVGFDEGGEKILDRLTSEEKELQIVSIVGMGGIGKTTLANSLFDHPSIRSCFHVCVRVCVSKVYERRNLFLDILQGIIGDQTEKFVKKCDQDLEEVLRQSLKGQRYLILMDDIWDIKAWLDLRASIPDDMNGIRIMFTSRSQRIASETKQSSSSYQLDLLSDAKSWEMLCSKLFQEEESCPVELVDLGKKISKSCQGLPLTVDLIAGVLRTKERNKYHWQQVAQNIMTEITDDPQQRCRKILEQSFNDLKDHLKPCFLYFAAFPDDIEVPTKRLIWLWMAEGFVHRKRLMKAKRTQQKLI